LPVAAQRQKLIQLCNLEYMRKFLSALSKMRFLSLKRDEFQTEKIDGDILNKLCTMDTLGGKISELQAFRESKIHKHLDEISEFEIEKYLKANPELVNFWLLYCDDKHACNKYWYIASPKQMIWSTDDVANGYKWRVGYLNSGVKENEIAFANKFAACAYFVKRRAESMRDHLF